MLKERVLNIELIVTYLKVKIFSGLGLDVVSLFLVHEVGCLSFNFEGELL